MTDNRETPRTDYAAHTSEPVSAAPGKTSSGIARRMSGVANIIHGTGEIIRGQALGERGHGDRKAIAAAGRDEVVRGLDKLEGKSSTTSTAAGATPGSNQRGVDDATGAVSGPAPTAPQAPATAPRSDGPTSGQARGDAGTTGYPPDKQTAGTATTTARDTRAGQYGNGQFATTTASRDHLLNADGLRVQRDNDVPQQWFEKRSAGDAQTGNASQRVDNVAGQEEYDGAAA